MTLANTLLDEVFGGPDGLAGYHHQCHAASLLIVNSRIVDGARVARGWARNITSQHSWVVVGDPYKPRLIIDPTMWSYTNTPPGILVFATPCADYRPHGAGSIWNATNRPPVAALGAGIDLELEDPYARMFMEHFGPFDQRGLHHLVNGPMEGWPARQIIEAMYRHAGLRGLVPIDIVGMVTDLNPGGLYLPTDDAMPERRSR